MASLKKTMVKKGFKCIPLELTATQHLTLEVKVNGHKGRFILDTGASNSCVGFEDVATFEMQTAETETKASGAGAVGMDTQKSLGNKLKIAKWKSKKETLVVFDMSHVNMALQEHKVPKIHGIIGADILVKHKAFIDYSKCLLYIK